MIIFGGRASNIGNFNVTNTKCNYCDLGDTQRVSIFGKYAHVFWVPFFPIGRKAVAECTHCKRTIEQKDFSPELHKQYREIKDKAKRPFWHWIGTGIFLLLSAFITYISMTTEVDPRAALLAEDEKLMIPNPTFETDSISYKIKSLFDDFTASEISPENFRYLTRIEEEKALVLVQIPQLKKVKKEARGEALEMVRMITKNQADLKEKDVYIGIKGVISMMLVKTPTYEGNGLILPELELYDFYGPKIKSKQ